MWNEYRKRFLISQVVIAAGVFVAWQAMQMPPRELWMVFIAMQIGGLLGAAMSAKIKREVQHKDDDLPLNRR